MAYTIALAGKGGTGKTTIAGITIRYLIEKTGKPVLAVDADSNACLNEALGIQVHTTIGKLREETLATIRSGDGRPGGMTTEELFDYRVRQAIIESRGFDLLVMGRPEGAGCYCAANNIIRKYTDKFSDNYPYVVIDNEAGMEHLSRRTTHDVDLLMIVSDPTVKGIVTAKRINDLVDELDLAVSKRILLINRVVREEGNKLKEIAEQNGLNVSGLIPEDKIIFNFDLQGKPVFEISGNSVSLKSIYTILDTLLALN